ncbi:U6 small nucleolar RNA-associated protein [Paramyrothecium foliicola]|nr:U6 small nucleolar RNA-associated protein [Paramyrothecium foliicola]
MRKEFGSVGRGWDERFYKYPDLTLPWNSTKMPGRQAHGRSLIAAPKARATKKSKARSQKNALDAFGIAQENFSTREKRTPRARQLDAEVDRKHGRDDEEEDDEEEEEAPRRKKVKAPPKALDGDGADFGSDSEGNEWQLGGLADDDNDSEIESDEAFGESDDERFQGYAFRGTNTKPQDDDSEDDENDDEGETLGEDAIDLATALDQYEETSEDEQQGDSASGSDDSDDDASDESVSDEDESEEEADPKNMEALQGLIAGFGGEDQDADAKDKKTSKPKIGLSDLGLAGLNDPLMKKSVKLMNKEDKELRPGATKKLAVPLAKRQQDRLDRSAAYEKTNETLDRWTETVKRNRRAEHLVFPLPQNSTMAGVAMDEIQPLSGKNPSNELESAIMSIMEQSGLSMDKPEKPKEQVYDEEGNLLTRKEIANKKRMEREANSREAKRAKRIKKIKSKAYHRVHRKQRERDEMAAKEAMEEAGEIDSEEEREAQDRRRALERVGQRHKDSKWAKLGSKTKRAVWDEDFRTGLTEMARKDEELRRRKEGKAGVSSDSDSDSASGSDDEDAALRRQLDRLEEEEDDEPHSKLMALKFMQKAEAAKKKENDEMIRQIRKDLDGDAAENSDDDEAGEVGRRQYGTAESKTFTPALDTSNRASKKTQLRDGDDGLGGASAVSNHLAVEGPADGAPMHLEETANTTLGAWSRGEARRKKKGTSGVRIDDLDLTSNVMVAAPRASSKAKSSASGKPASKAKQQDGGDNEDDSDSDAAADQHLPMAIRDQELVARAFAGEDVVGQFQREKEEIEEADDDKVVDNTLPGWGSWVGDGVSARELNRHKGRFLTKVEGVKKKDRKDAKLDKVIINEKRVKKNDRYLASQLPHPFESRQQYERSLRLPVGPEWMTKETFQERTKPRVLMKQGIIAPMSKPTI